MKIRYPTEEEIRNRAHQIYLERGCEGGHEISDWLQAEYELMQLPTHKIAELDPPKGRSYRKTLVGLVRAAFSVVGGGSTPRH